MIQRAVLIAVFCFILLGAAHAQIVLSPPDAAGSAWFSMSSTILIHWYDRVCGGQPPWTTTMYWSGYDSGCRSNLMLSFQQWTSHFYHQTTFHCTGYTYTWTYSEYLYNGSSNNYIFLTESNVVIEFDISSLTGAGVTAKNFQSAHIDGLEVISATGSGAQAVLLDLFDAQEDGVVTKWDSGMTPILDIFDTTPSVGTVFNDLDVTAAVFNDLFGTGSAEDYSGFVIIGEKGPVVFDRVLPSLRITINEPEVPSLSIFSVLIFCFFFTLFAILRFRKPQSTP